MIENVSKLLVRFEGGLDNCLVFLKSFVVREQNMGRCGCERWMTNGHHEHSNTPLRWKHGRPCNNAGLIIWTILCLQILFMSSLVFVTWDIHSFFFPIWRPCKKGRTTSHTSPRPWPCICEGLRSTSKDPKWHQTYLLKVQPMQIMAHHETLFTIYNIGTHVDFSSMMKFLEPLDLRLLLWQELGRYRLFFRPIESSSNAMVAGLLCHVCEVAPWHTKLMMAHHETLFTIYNVRVHVGFSFMMVSLGPWALALYCEGNLDGIELFLPNERSWNAMFAGLQSRVCEVAPNP